MWNMKAKIIQRLETNEAYMKRRTKTRRIKVEKECTEEVHIEIADGTNVESIASGECDREHRLKYKCIHKWVSEWERDTQNNTVRQRTAFGSGIGWFACKLAQYIFLHQSTDMNFFASFFHLILTHLRARSHKFRWFLFTDIFFFSLLSFLRVDAFFISTHTFFSPIPFTWWC